MNKLEPIAQAMGVEIASSRDFNNEYSYHHGRYSPRVYTSGDKYFCCSSTKPKADVGEWVLFHDQFWAERNSTKLWVTV